MRVPDPDSVEKGARERPFRANWRTGRGGGGVRHREPMPRDQTRPATPTRAWRVQASAMFVRKFSYSTDAGRSVDAERSRGLTRSSSSHPVCLSLGAPALSANRGSQGFP